MDIILTALKSLIPARIETAIGLTTGGIGVVMNYLFGEWNNALELLVIAMVMDYVTGVIAAYINPDMLLNSKRGFAGILKKLMILMLVSFAHFMDSALGQSVVCVAVTWFFIGNEGLSVIENAAKAGLPVPEKLKDTLEQLAHEKEARR